MTATERVKAFISEFTGGIIGIYGPNQLNVTDLEEVLQQHEDMLDALEQIAAVKSNGNPDNWLKECKNLARKAIARAKGETQIEEMK